jgi:hypothetical protein
VPVFVRPGPQSAPALSLRSRQRCGRAAGAPASL